MYDHKIMVREDFQYMSIEDKYVLYTRSTQYLKKWVPNCNKAMRKNPVADRIETASRTVQAGKGPKKNKVEVMVYRN